MRDWPGLAGPVVHLPDPVSPEPSVVDDLAASLAPSYRVVSIAARSGVAYQVQAADVLGAIDQFGFRPVLVGERLGCLVALLVAAWFPGRVAGLVLLDPPREEPGVSDSLLARSLRDCPADWSRLRASVRCPMLEPKAEASVSAVEAFVRATLP
jgi:pimeloyl-ACP methyl ester carboxylesterase